ncbi:MAG: ribonucleoside triphosphate reductase, partial [Clostridia bacterium]|nr:ribonucleoside triphosphate reductase [Clostridia bacterium]
MYKVMKRDGTVAEFDIAKISTALTKAFAACKAETHPTVIDLLALRVTSDFAPKIKNGLITVEEIQDSAERVLSQAGYTDVAKAYILYRKQREKVRNVRAAMLNYKDLVDRYLDASD